MQFASHSLSKDGIELLGDVVLFVADPFGAQLKHEVRIRLAVDIHRVKIVCLYHVNPDEHVQGIIGGQALNHTVTWTPFTAQHFSTF